MEQGKKGGKTPHLVVRNYDAHPLASAWRLAGARHTCYALSRSASIHAYTNSRPSSAQCACSTCRAQGLSEAVRAEQVREHGGGDRPGERGAVFEREGLGRDGKAGSEGEVVEGEDGGVPRRGFGCPEVGSK